jgi:carbamoyltransferase
MIIWGISANSHDAAITVVDNNTIIFASQSERYSKKKNDMHLHVDLIADARKYGEPELIVWYEKPVLKTLRQLFSGQGWRWNENNVKKYLTGYGIVAPIKYVSHHKSHAAGGYFTSPFKDAAVLVIDAIGEFDTTTIWHGKQHSLKRKMTVAYPHSLGLWYSAMTQRIGLKPNEEEYILMGMAAYGNPTKYSLDILHDFFKTEENIHPNEMFPEDTLLRLKHNLHRGCSWWKPELKTKKQYYDIAASTQFVYELYFHDLLSRAQQITQSKNLVLGGGCALNCVANEIALCYFDNVWIMPNPGDAGNSLGAVAAYTNQFLHWEHPYLGHEITGGYPVEAALQELLTHKLVGVASGKAEFGPRALGNRSLLADPRGPDMKDKVNKIKKRQKFRPFAPVILEERASEYFYMPTEKTPYMQYTALCKTPEEFPAIVHADGTSRVQTVSEKDNPGLYQLLKRWEQETGCPMLLNTSLNIKGQPIVNDEVDAKKFQKKYKVKVCV